jgi:chromosome segregation ATPase
VKYGASIVFAIVAVLFAGHCQTVWTLGGDTLTSDHGTIFTVRLLEAERDRLLSGGAMFLLLVIYRHYRAIAACNRLGRLHFAMEKQARNAGEACQIFMDEKSALEKEVKQLKKHAAKAAAAPTTQTPSKKVSDYDDDGGDDDGGGGSNGGGGGNGDATAAPAAAAVAAAAEIASLQERVAVSQEMMSAAGNAATAAEAAAAAATAETAVLQQRVAAADADAAAAAREIRALKTQLEDYDLFLGDARKKKV